MEHFEKLTFDKMLEEIGTGVNISFKNRKPGFLAYLTKGEWFFLANRFLGNQYLVFGP